MEKTAIADAISHDRNQKNKKPSRKPTLRVTRTNEINNAVIMAIKTANFTSALERRHLIIQIYEKAHF
jgi:hypothetical protein